MGTKVGTDSDNTRIGGHPQGQEDRYLTIKWTQDRGHRIGQTGQGYSITHRTYSSHSKIEVPQGITEHATGVECKAILEDNASYR